jgi:hypothetical protein
MAKDPLTGVLNIGGKLIDRLWPSETDKAAARLELLKLAQSGELTVLTSQANIIQTEAASSHWLASNWRPLTMLTFVVLIVARWFGWAAPDLSPEEYIKLWDIVQLGLGGYVIGRSAEKIVPTLIAARK